MSPRSEFHTGISSHSTVPIRKQQVNNRLKPTAVNSLGKSLHSGRLPEVPLPGSPKVAPSPNSPDFAASSPIAASLHISGETALIVALDIRCFPLAKLADKCKRNLVIDSATSFLSADKWIGNYAIYGEQDTLRRSVVLP